MNSTFLIGKIRSLERLAGAVCLCSTLVAGSVELQRGKDRIDVVVDGKPFTTYYFGAEFAKPYLMPLRTGGGVIVTRGFPVGNDVSAGNPKASSFEPHQRPLYFAHGDIDGLDFWAEPAFDKYYGDHGHQAYGHMVLDKVEEVKASGELGSHPGQFPSGGSQRPPNCRRDADLPLRGDGRHAHRRLRVHRSRDERPGRFRRHERRDVRHTACAGAERAARPHDELEWRARGKGDLGKTGELGELLRDRRREGGGHRRVRPSHEFSSPDDVACAGLRIVRGEPVRTA